MLLATQAMFNIGFYAVVPFLALVLSRDFGLAAAAIGLVLGIRTFAQQGLFVVGGSLADRAGARTIILAGVAIRVTGFLLLSGALLTPAPSFALFLAGTVLTGIGGALFSPGLNTLVAAAEGAGARGRVTLFAWLTVAGELGAVLGPLLGAALLGLGFAVAAAAGAAYFAAIGITLAFLLPRARRTEGGNPTPLRSALRDRALRRFAALHSVDLLAYNQLYLAVPLVLAGGAAAVQTTAAVFAWASALTLVGQLPVARWTARLGASRALRVAYLCSAAGFALIAAASTAPDPTRTMLVFAATTSFILGHLAANPTALHLIPAVARPGAIGASFGLLATAGGAAVLTGNVGGGLLLDALPEAWSWLPWLLLGGACVASAVLVRGALTALRQHSPVVSRSAR
ncbi:MFS transporter [Microbacterium sp.]|uniref:MFS transporter n=1 Tax=Microbacterium sp. TaxID=51671 RepID=UPI0039E4AB4C